MAWERRGRRKTHIIVNLRRGFTVLTGLVVLALAAVALGYYFGGFVTKMLIGRPPATEEPGRGVSEEPGENFSSPGQVGRESGLESLPITLEGLTLYRVQLGVFESPANASRMVADLQESGLPAYVTATSPYRVLSAFFSSRDEALAYASKNLGSREFLVALTEIKARQLLIPPAESEHQETLRLALEALNEFIVAEGPLLGEAAGKPGPGFKDSVELLAEAIREARSSFLGHEFPQTLDSLVDEIENLFGLCTRSIGELQLVSEGSAEVGDSAAFARAMTAFVELVEEFLTFTEALSG